MNTQIQVIQELDLIESNLIVAICKTEWKNHIVKLESKPFKYEGQYLTHNSVLEHFDSASKEVIKETDCPIKLTTQFLHLCPTSRMIAGMNKPTFDPGFLNNITL